VLDTKLGKVLGAVAAFAAAVLLYRAVNRVFVWVFSVGIFGVGAWLATLVGGILLVILAGRLWSRWRLLLGSVLLFFSAWSILHLVPAIHSASTRVQGYYDDRFDLVQTSAAWCTAIVVAVLGLVALGREALTSAIHKLSRAKKEPAAGARRAG
jgi:hypothetical protein